MGTQDVLRPGQMFDRYRIEETVGDGGMGRVYRAHDAKLDRFVALKVLKPSLSEDGATRERAEARLLAEGRAMARLSSPYVVRIFDVGTFEGMPFLAMELVTGTTLRERVGASLKQKLSWLRDVARGLAAAHRAELVHRDIKPDNVMVRDDGRAVVLDFGIARSKGDGSSVALRVRGTVPYMAPEQILGGPIDCWTDQFAWGVTAYELLSDVLPWGDSSNPMKIVQAILHGDPPCLTSVAPEVPAKLAAIIARALAKEPADRFDSMDDVLSRLESLAKPIDEEDGVAPSHRRPVGDRTTLSTEELAITLAPTGRSGSRGRSCDPTGGSSFESPHAGRTHRCCSSPRHD